MKAKIKTLLLIVIVSVVISGSKIIKHKADVFYNNSGAIKICNTVIPVQ